MHIALVLKLNSAYLQEVYSLVRETHITSVLSSSYSFQLNGN